MTATVFLGTPTSAVPSLRALATVSDIRLVVTMPDRPVRRSGTPQPSAVRVAAQEMGLAVETPATGAELLAALDEHTPDLGVVVAYGRILTAEMLGRPRLGMVNVHFSLLPRWRGAAPVERAMLAGDQVTGTTLMQIDEGLDTGPVLTRWSTSVERHETAGELTDRLAAGGAEMLAGAVPDLGGGRLVPVAQDDDEASHAPRLTTAEAAIDWSKSAATVVRAIYAYNPRPGAFTMRGDHRIKIHRARVVGGDAQPGEVELADDRVVVGAGDGRVEILELQVAGSRAMAASDWGRGQRDRDTPFT